MPPERPHLIVLAGPNGAGKTTVSAELLRGALGVHEFVNADTIARGLSEFKPEGVAIEAGRVLLRRLHHLTAQRLDVAFETTLASRSFAPWIRGLKASGYDFHLFFISLPTPEIAIERVRSRAQRGGHSVPDDTIRRRFAAGLRNFFELYRPLAATWRFYDNEHSPGLRLIARGGAGKTEIVADLEMWGRIEREWNRD
jgi:predicted ABC-type ATPase